MKRYFFHMSDDIVEIRDKMGVSLPDGEDLVSFCKKLVLAVALEDHNELFDIHTVIIADENGDEVVTIPVGDLVAGGEDSVPDNTLRLELH